MILLIAISALTVWGILKAVSKCASKSAEKIRQESIQAQETARAEQARIRLEWQQRQEEARMETQRLIALEREQMRQAKEQERISKEQERQAEVLRKHEERIMKLEQRMASAESEIAFNREQRARLFKLLDIEERMLNTSTKDSDAWQKHQRKVIALENQIHTVQKRIDKAQADKWFCEKQISA